MPETPTDFAVPTNRTDTTPVFTGTAVASSGEPYDVRLFIELETAGGTPIGTPTGTYRASPNPDSAEWTSALAIGNYRAKAHTQSSFLGNLSAATSYIAFSIVTLITKDIQV